MKIVSKVVVPFSQPWETDERTTDAAILDLVAATPETPVLGHWGERPKLAVRELGRSKALPEVALAWQPARPFSYRFLCFEAIARVDESAVRALLEGNNPGWKPQLPELDGLIRQLTAESVSQSVGHVLLAAQLAKPGAVNFDDRIIIGPSRMVRLDKGISIGFDGVVRRAKRTGWPRIGSLSVADTLQWLLGVPGLLHGDPSGPAGRAISALANLAMRPSPTEGDAVGLMWCMVGLEAIYGEGTASLAQQLSQKSRVVLGEPETFRKAVSKMYDLRSRFIHGDIDFPLPYRYDDPDPAQFTGPMDDAVQLALGILIATLQRLVDLRCYAFGFEYRLQETSPSAT